MRLNGIEQRDLFTAFAPVTSPSIPECSPRVLSSVRVPADHSSVAGKFSAVGRWWFGRCAGVRGTIRLGRGRCCGEPVRCGEGQGLSTHAMGPLTPVGSGAVWLPGSYDPHQAVRRTRGRSG